MKINTDFEATIVIGLYCTMAILKLKEAHLEGFIHQSDEDESYCVVRNDIDNYGLEDWLGIFSDIPGGTGIYLVKGSAWASEDDVEYQPGEWQMLTEI